MIVPASAEKFDGVRDFASNLSEALRPSFDVQSFTTAEDCAPGPATAVLDRWASLPAAPSAGVIYINYLPQAWMRGDARSLLSRLEAARRSGSRVVLIVHEYQLDPRPSPARIAGRFIFGRLARTFASQADTIVATHRFVADWMRADGLDRKSPVVTIPVGSNLPEPEAQAAGRRANRVVMFGQPAGMSPAQVAAVSTAAPHQRADVVWVCRSGEEARAWMARHGVNASAIRLAAGLEHPAASRELCEASIGFAPIVDGVSTRRTGVAALLQHRLPVAGSDGRATDTLLRDSPAFDLSPVADGGGAARAVGALLVDQLRRERMAEAARSLFDSHLSWRRIAAAYARLARA